MREITRILCPVEFCESSRHAIDHAMLLARWYGAKITALHVCNPMVVPSIHFAGEGTYLPSVRIDEEVESARRQLAESFAGVMGVDVDLRVEVGNVAKEIVQWSQALPADLLVIGTHGLTGFEHLVLGSVTEKVLRQAVCPVLTVPPHARATSKLPFERILCPVDFSEPSLAALDFALSLAVESDAAVTILHAFEWPEEPLTTRPITVPEYRAVLEHDVLERLNALVPDGTADRRRPTPRLAHGKAYREILSHAADEGADLIVMGVHGRGALDLMLFGSTTNQVVRRATCPVLTLRR